MFNGVTSAQTRLKERTEVEVYSIAPAIANTDVRGVLFRKVLLLEAYVFFS